MTDEMTLYELSHAIAKARRWKSVYTRRGWKVVDANGESVISHVARYWQTSDDAWDNTVRLEGVWPTDANAALELLAYRGGYYELKNDMTGDHGMIHRARIDWNDEWTGCGKTPAEAIARAWLAWKAEQDD